MASKVFIEETKKFRIHHGNTVSSDFLDLETLKIPVVIENQTLALFWNETSTGVMNFKDSLIPIVEQILRAIILTGHTFEVIHQTRFTEFGGKLGNQQRPILEEIDMKARPVQSAKE